MLTYTRTILILLFLLLLGTLIIRKTKVITTLLVGAFFGGLVIASTLIDLLPKEEVRLRWESRLFARSLFEEQNVVARRVAIEEALKEVAQRDTDTLLLGTGLKTANEFSLSISGKLATLDNNYVTVLYESGLFGLAVYGVFMVGYLWRYRRLAWDSLHYYNVLSLFLTGFSFVFYTYFTFNLMAVASLAWISVMAKARSPSPL